MKSLITLFLVVVSLATSWDVACGKSRRHDARFYEIKRYNRTNYIAHYSSMGPPWFELHPQVQMAKQSYRQPAAPQIKMLRIDGPTGPRFYREVIWIEEVWTVDGPFFNLRRDPMKKEK